MSRINRLSSLRSNRIRSSYVNRMNPTSNIAKVEALTRTEKGKNRGDHPSESYLNSYEFFYRRMNELKAEFKKFYHREKELYRAIEQLDTSMQTIVEHTNNLIKKYNETLQALTAFDKLAGLNYVSSVRQGFQRFQGKLQSLGIVETDSGLLQFNETVFIDFLEREQTNFEQLLNEFKLLIIEQYRSFTKVRVTTAKNNPYEQTDFQYKGLIIEEES